MSQRERKEGVRVAVVERYVGRRAENDERPRRVDLQGLEDEFVKAAPDYSRRKGITYAAWREAGVDPAVLRRAGIRRAGGA